jgi:hypothetical protein
MIQPTPAVPPNLTPEEQSWQRFLAWWEPLRAKEDCRSAPGTRIIYLNVPNMLRSQPTSPEFHRWFAHPKFQALGFKVRQWQETWVKDGLGRIYQGRPHPMDRSFVEDCTSIQW